MRWHQLNDKIKAFGTVEYTIRYLAYAKTFSAKAGLDIIGRYYSQADAIKACVQYEKELKEISN